jgi:putative ABC transport system permease protein
VNEAFAKRYLSGSDPLAASISVLMRDDNPYGRIVGIVGDVHEGSLRKGTEPTVFYNHAQLPYPGMTLFIRANRAASLAQAAGQVIRGMDSNQAVTNVRTLEEVFAESLARERLNAVVSAAFALSALLLASLGVYGVLAFLVVERTREIGVRMALGAQAWSVLRMVLDQGLRLVAMGAVVGLGGALAVSRLIEGLLFGVTPTDPATFASVLALLAAVSVVAALVPARRATRVDPLSVLRQE